MRVAFQLIVSALVMTASASAGSIIVNNDEWTLSNSGFSSAGATNVTNFAQNAALFLTGGPNSGATKVWIDSDDFGLTGSDLSTALSAYNLTDSGSFSAFTLSTLEGYQAVFLGGDTLTSAEETALIAYVNAGGGVYVAAGTGNITTGGGGAAGEAAQWNAFLNTFDLNLASTYNGFTGTFATDGTSPILNGVAQLFYDNGNTVNTTGSLAQIITDLNGAGLIGAYPGAPSSPVPEPSTVLLVTIAMAGVGLYGGKRRRS
ncbi:MAG: PEP-CTERM sorting domain-containing protein [Bryobacteraceae bacterium]|jgi:hypothetical protein